MSSRPIVRRFARAAAAVALLLLPILSAEAQPGPLGRTPSRFALFEGNRVHFKSLGTGRTAVVFVHGWASDMSVWAPQADALGGRTRVVLLDLPGHGRSDKPQSAYSMDLFARAVDAVLESAGVDKAVLVGHSMGAPVARQVLRRYPDRVLALVAVDGALQWPDHWPPGDSDASRQMLTGLRAAEYRTAVEGMVSGMVGSTAAGELRSAVLHAALATPQHVLVSAMEGMFDQSIWNRDPIAVPVLAVMDQGPNWTPAYRQRLSGVAADLTYEEVDSVGHYLMTERPEVFNPMLTRFLSFLRILR
jgi:pimeloyl-ACP methyl ester carboxylesterase